MGALLTSIVRAPLTGIVLMIELTGKYDFMLPLLVSCFVAYGIAEALGDVPIYEALRLRAGKRAGAAGSCPPPQRALARASSTDLRSARLITMRCTSDEPSPISLSRASRQ